MSVTLDKIKEELDRIKEEMRPLAPEEQQAVRGLVDSLLSEPMTRPQTEDELEGVFEREPAAEGFIAPVEMLTATEEEVREYRAYKPINVEGRPLSEMLAEGRR